MLALTWPQYVRLVETIEAENARQERELQRIRDCAGAAPAGTKAPKTIRPQSAEHLMQFLSHGISGGFAQRGSE